MLPKCKILPNLVTLLNLYKIGGSALFALKSGLLHFLNETVEGVAQDRSSRRQCF